ncbi:unnamed protein product [Chilo suppressalis]|uniref:RHD domain-containing protein n=1 Tax=Chilo suppressalis TaxID=168631 RepID=A0ABN8BIT9_CHISP|nr:hypothetical protein evm_012492 [Chilo suppressalis]CAH0407357.1 unnamed protein product [Chilo suppressalis]
MSASDDTESYYIESPLSQFDSPYSSPSQQVPQLASSMTGLSCADGKPQLRILEQPQNHFRFRYKSEMVGTHGCLLGESYANSKTKTHPTVELVNFSGRAVIRCRLAQHKTADEHPHKLLEEEQDRDVSYVVPEQGSYKVGFAGMGIIHTAKKDVPGLLYKKYSESVHNSRVNPKDLKVFCENEAKSINLNIVRLRFSAHDINTDQEICPPVFSNPIFNMKCAATNDLRICRISRTCGRAAGGEDVFLLVEKVNKKNIMVRFYELNDNGDEVWSAPGHFLQSDVHHQYAIVFRTPQYQDPNTPVQKKVFIELVRPTDGRVSEPKEFYYKAAPTSKFNKKRKVNSAFSSYSSTDSSVRSINSEIPATVLFMNEKNEQAEEELKNDQFFNIPQIPQIPKSSPLSSNDLGEALYGMQTQSSPSESNFYDSPMLPQAIVEPPDLQLNSAELERILKVNTSLPVEEKERFCNADWTEYLKSYSDSLNDENHSKMESLTMEIVRSMLTTDSGRQVKTEASSKMENKILIKQENLNTNPDQFNNGTEYSAVYTASEGKEVKKLVRDLCEMIRTKTGIQKPIVRAKLDRLFEMRLSNGDTFLHMTLCRKEPSLECIIKLVHSMKMTHLLNLTNKQSQTILHLAVIHDMPNVIPLLVDKGCDPMIEDLEGNNVIHNAVIYQSCLEPLLTALKRSRVSFNLNAFNNEKQTALHLAVIHKSAASVRQLMRNGASNNVRDSDGRTPLHLAAYDDCLEVAQELLEYVAPSEIDALDGRGYTALQVVCDGGVRKHTYDLVKLLLLKKADPRKCEENSSSAWHMAKDKPLIREVMKACSAFTVGLEDDDIKSEPEDEFESADESEIVDSGLAELSQYSGEVCAILDASEGWRRLADRLQLQTLHSWYANTSSPARTLLHHLKECDNNITSKSLATILEEIGETKAALIIRRHID